MKRPDGVDTFYAKDREEWRKWLAENHATSKSIWLIIYHKKANTSSVYYDEAVDEALCFGWIDSKPNKRDEESFFQYFSKRNPKSNWSRVNKEKVQKLLDQKLMAESGLAMIREAKKMGTWTALDEVENLVIPADLQTAFNQYTVAQKHFAAFPKSVKKSILEWIFNAKRDTTRAKRVEETASLAQQNIRANQYKNKQ